MDVDQPSALAAPDTYRNHPRINAVAGPSRISPLPNLFLPPPNPLQPQTHLRSTEDLVTRFNLLSAYDKYVRPFAVPARAQDETKGPEPTTPIGTDRWKGKQRESSVPCAAPTPAGLNDGDGDDDEGGKGDKKRKNNYRHLIRGIPGKHSMKKDDYLTTMMQVPPKQRNNIQPFDLRTQREAFSVSLTGLQSWNPTALVGESQQAREDRKRRKELKKLARQTAAGNVAGVPTPTSATFPPSTPAIAMPPAPGFRPPISRSGSRPPPVQTGTPGPGTPRHAHPLPARPASTQPGTPRLGAAMAVDSATLKRGTKRELDDGANGHVPGTPHNGAVTVMPILGAKAGVPGARPRPIKKQRMDMQGQAREMPIQQPTPQGV
ncbi:hypothetical protein PUNSTDRAFT_146218 [Punctularia strigosozonata HHB-11173 SS5]|uniref:Mediator of RNA polymerase II transcription subunit 19 n=1 Tax=Punctularia strigosozonata (strain HHB-11173) TaxID=741275 RepID=R7S3F1_PUNST|nr:uncharacterized protein PUNSTDRAFT_146218 [Punctularia strigosozonata HHB-11173 SS5]EIN04940.1 hypothetical protein PUNSTDRAFT_146218 [Punctularia strigosozonata HHB-11173 SS5]